MSDHSVKVISLLKVFFLKGNVDFKGLRKPDSITSNTETNNKVSLVSNVICCFFGL